MKKETINTGDLVIITGKSRLEKKYLPVYIVLKKEAVYFKEQFYTEYLLYSAEIGRKFYCSSDKPYENIVKI